MRELPLDAQGRLWSLHLESYFPVTLAVTL